MLNAIMNRQPSPEIINSYGALAYDIASQYVERPDLLRIVPEFSIGYPGTTNTTKPTVIVQFPGMHTKADYGKLIGGKGANYRALLRLLRQYGSHFRHEVELEILDPGGPMDRGPDFKPDENWHRDEEFREKLQSIAERVFAYPVGARVYSTYDITHLVIETGVISPTLLGAFQVLWIAIGKNHGRNFKLVAEAPKEQAV